MKNPHNNCGDKKTIRSKTVNPNPLFEIKLYRFTLALYPKDLLSNTYKLIHIRNVVTFNCSSEYTSTQKGYNKVFISN